jgi:uncharacterized protein
VNVVELSGLIGVASIFAGLLGSLTGLGGGVVIIPVLTLAFGVDLRYAIGASLVSVIATSSGAAAAYIKEGYINLRIGMLLEVATTLGAIAGASLAAIVPVNAIALVFGVVLLYSAYLSHRPHVKGEPAAPDRWALRFRLDSAVPTLDGPRPYHVRRLHIGFGLMGLAGALSGLLGIGSGAVKVLALDQAMQLPFKVSTTTSNFMIGVTAAASAGVYLSRGYIDPGLAMPVTLGVLLGSLLGARLLVATSSRRLRIVFSAVVFVLAVQMAYGGVMGRF